MKCHLCLKPFTLHKDYKMDFLICKTKSCKNIKLIAEGQHEKDCYFILSGSSFIKGQIYLKINISMLLFVPDLFENALDENTMEIYRSFSNFHKRFDSIDAFHSCVNLYRSKMAFFNKKEDYFFKNYFDNMILKLGISKYFQMSYTRSFLCSHCKFSFNKSISANYIIESLIVNCPTFSENRMVYEIKCGKCSNNGVVKFDFENKSKFLVLFLKEGFFKSENSNLENCLKNNFVILETDEPFNKKFSLWIKSDKLWYCENNISPKILKSYDNPEINSTNVRVMFYEFDGNLSLNNNNNNNSEICSNDNGKRVKTNPNIVDLDGMIEAKKRKLNDKIYLVKEIKKGNKRD